MLGALGCHHGEQFRRRAAIEPAENGFIVSTIHQIEVDNPQLPDVIPGDEWMGGQQKKITQTVAKQHVFTDVDEALAHMKTYMEGEK
jgi:hypothetical protein